MMIEIIIGVYTGSLIKSIVTIANEIKIALKIFNAEKITLVNAPVF